VEPKIMKAVKNLQAYQNEPRDWRDKKVKEKTIEVEDIVLLRSPHIEPSSKLEPKWVGPCLITEKQASVFLLGKCNTPSVTAAATVTP
jgi:hypothetical protein